MHLICICCICSILQFHLFCFEKGTTMELKLDSDHRVAFEGSLNFNFRSFSIKNLPSSDAAVLSSLLEDCKVAFTCKNVDSHSSDSYSSGSTFFHRSDKSPRCLLEQLALEVFKLHTKDANFDPTTSGAEWWSLVIDSRDDVGFHWDRDYGLEDSGLHVYPHIATVTYLSSEGGPTLVFNKKGTKDMDEEPVGACDHLIVSKPRLGKHICFDGSLFHGAPSAVHADENSDSSSGSDSSDADDSDASNEASSDDDSESENDNDESIESGSAKSKSDSGRSKAEDASSQGESESIVRVTFLVNIWLNHIPVESRPLPSKYIKKMSPPLVADVKESAQSVFEIIDDGQSGRTVIELPAENDALKDASLILNSWKFSNHDKKYKVHIPLPPPSVFETQFSNSNNLELIYPSNEQSIYIEQAARNSNSGGSRSTLSEQAALEPASKKQRQ